jgi:mannose-6-phosphate isomerase-like protein (cupin superfamily)
VEDTTTAIAAALGEVALRLKQLRERRGVTLIRTPGWVQAWKIIVPASNSEPSPKSHDGYEWLFALSGRRRPVLGDQDLVLGAGEAGEFDTRVPHWFGSTGDQPAEILSMFGPQGEGAQARAMTVGKKASAE